MHRWNFCPLLHREFEQPKWRIDDRVLHFVLVYRNLMRGTDEVDGREYCASIYAVGIVNVPDGKAIRDCPCVGSHVVTTPAPAFVLGYGV